MTFQSPAREYRTWAFDSRRWNGYRPREDDIVVATYPKCGTTWTQRILQMLIFRSTEALPISDVSPWPDSRIFEPIEALLERIEGQTHRRSLKAHLPFDGLPIYDKVKYLHVARDGRDASLSWFGHAKNFKPEILSRLNEAGLGDEAVARPYPMPLDDPAENFHRWLTEGIVAGDDDGVPHMSYFHFEQTWWEARHRPNVLLVHFADLKADLGGEMRRIAEFLDIDIPQELWPSLVEAASFEAMRRDADKMLGKVSQVFKGGGQSFFNKGENKRWLGVFRDEDLALYEQKLSRKCTAECAHWLTNGRLGAT